MDEEGNREEEEIDEEEEDAQLGRTTGTSEQGAAEALLNLQMSQGTQEETQHQVQWLIVPGACQRLLGLGTGLQGSSRGLLWVAEGLLRVAEGLLGVPEGLVWVAGLADGLLRVAQGC